MYSVTSQRRECVCTQTSWFIIIIIKWQGLKWIIHHLLLTSPVHSSSLECKSTSIKHSRQLCCLEILEGQGYVSQHIRYYFSLLIVPLWGEVQSCSQWKRNIYTKEYTEDWTLYYIFKPVGLMRCISESWGDWLMQLELHDLSRAFPNQTILWLCCSALAIVTYVGQF